MKKIALYPSLLALAEKKETWNSEISRVEPISSGIHYDIWDGQFVPSLMLDPQDIGLIQTKLPIDVHLMVRKPTEYFEKLLSFPSVQAISFHIESDEDVHGNIQALKNAGKKVGLAILDITPSDHLDPYLAEVDYVVVMTIKWGYSGTPFNPEILQKISAIRNKNPELLIVVDGGIAEKTILPCIQAGATGAVMSSALFGGGDISWLGEYVN